MSYNYTWIKHCVQQQYMGNTICTITIYGHTICTITIYGQLIWTKTIWANNNNIWINQYVKNQYMDRHYKQV